MNKKKNEGGGKSKLSERMSTNEKKVVSTKLLALIWLDAIRATFRNQVKRSTSITMEIHYTLQNETTIISMAIRS